MARPLAQVPRQTDAQDAARAARASAPGGGGLSSANGRTSAQTGGPSGANVGALGVGAVPAAPAPTREPGAAGRVVLPQTEVDALIRYVQGLPPRRLRPFDEGGALHLASGDGVAHADDASRKWAAFVNRARHLFDACDLADESVEHLSRGLSDAGFGWSTAGNCGCNECFESARREGVFGGLHRYLYVERIQPLPQEDRNPLTAAELANRLMPDWSRYWRKLQDLTLAKLGGQRDKHAPISRSELGNLTEPPGARQLHRQLNAHRRRGGESLVAHGLQGYERAVQANFPGTEEDHYELGCQCCGMKHYVGVTNDAKLRHQQHGDGFVGQAGDNPARAAPLLGVDRRRGSAYVRHWLTVHEHGAGGGGRQWWLGARLHARDVFGFRGPPIFTFSEEDRRTLFEMGRHGLHHVRGGPYVRLVLDGGELCDVLLRLRANAGRCFLCGALGQYAGHAGCAPSSRGGVVLAARALAGAQALVEPADDDAALTAERDLRPRPSPEPADEWARRVAATAAGVLLHAPGDDKCCVLIRTALAGDDTSDARTLRADDSDRELLRICGLQRLRLVQREAVEAVLDLAAPHIVLTAPTAGGKTRPYLFACLRTAAMGGRAAIVFPMKAVLFEVAQALAEITQLCGGTQHARVIDPRSRQLRPYGGDFDAAGSIIKWGVFYGSEHDAGMRELEQRGFLAECNVLLCTPDKLSENGSGSTSEQMVRHLGPRWVRDLDLLVVDEAHMFRGLPGLALRLLVERMRAIKQAVHAREPSAGGGPSPLRLFLASATLPAADIFARELIGGGAAITWVRDRGSELVDGDALRGNELPDAAGLAALLTRSSPDGLPYRARLLIVANCPLTDWTVTRLIFSLAAGADSAGAGASAGGAAGSRGQGGVGGCSSAAPNADGAADRTPRRVLIFVNGRMQAERLAVCIERALHAGGAAMPLRPFVNVYTGGTPKYKRSLVEATLSREVDVGQLHVLVATSALEMGVNIAGLHLVVLPSEPADAASMRQRLGRAGRAAGFPGLVLIGAKPESPLVEHPAETLGLQTAGQASSAAAGSSDTDTADDDQVTGTHVARSRTRELASELALKLDEWHVNTRWLPAAHDDDQAAPAGPGPSKAELAALRASPAWVALEAELGPMLPASARGPPMRLCAFDRGISPFSATLLRYELLPDNRGGGDVLRPWVRALADATAASQPVELHYLSGADQLFSSGHPGALIRLQSGVYKVVAYELSQALNKEQLHSYQRTVDAALHLRLKVCMSGAVDLTGSASLLIDEQTGACLRCWLPVRHAAGAAHAHRTSDAPTAACVECGPGVTVQSCPRSSLKLCAFRSWHEVDGTECARCPAGTPTDQCPASIARLHSAAASGAPIGAWLSRLRAVRVVRVPRPHVHVESRGRFEDRFEWVGAAATARPPAGAPHLPEEGRVRWTRTLSGCDYFLANGSKGASVSADDLLTRARGFGFTPFERPHRDELAGWRWCSPVPPPPLAAASSGGADVLRLAADVLRWRVTRLLSCAFGDVLVALEVEPVQQRIVMWVADPSAAGLSREALLLQHGLGPFARFTSELAFTAAAGPQTSGLLAILRSLAARRAQRDYLEAELLDACESDLAADNGPLDSLLAALSAAWRLNVLASGGAGGGSGGAGGVGAGPSAAGGGCGVSGAAQHSGA